MTSVMNDRGLSSVEEYSGFAKLLHWVIAACVLGMIPVGIVMLRLEPGDLQNDLYNLHRSFGVLVLALMLVRLAYRLVNGVPAPEPTLTAGQRIGPGRRIRVAAAQPGICETTGNCRTTPNRRAVFISSSGGPVA